MSQLNPTSLFSSRQGLWLGISLSLLTGVFLYILTARSIASATDERFANLARNAANSIDARVKAYSNVLRGTVSLFGASEEVSREEFRAYVDGLGIEEHFPAIESMTYMVRFKHTELAKFEAQLRAGNLSDGTSLAARSLYPAGERAEHEMTLYVEPEDRWSHTIGFDLLSIDPIQDYMNEWIDSGKLSATGKPIALISKPGRVSLGMRLAVYQPGVELSSRDQRRAAYRGSVGLAFSVPRLLEGVLLEFPAKNVQLVLTGPANPDNGSSPLVLYDSAQLAGVSARLDQASSSVFLKRMPIDFYGQSWEATFAADAKDIYSPIEKIAPWLALLAGFVSTLLVTALFQALASSRRRALRLAEEMTRELRDSQAHLQLSHQNLRRLAAHSDKIKEVERKRIAREIHDDLGQNLLALRIEADLLSTRTSQRHPRLHARARATLQQIDSTIRSVRQIINDLRPNVLDLGLAPAVEWQVAQFTQRTGIPCEVVDEIREARLNDHAATALFRILQESLSNIERHARATRVRIALRITTQGMEMTIGDDGVGLTDHARDKMGSFGLVGIEERITILGGQCAISGECGKGTTVWVSVPAHQAFIAPAETHEPSSTQETASIPPQYSPVD
jgi:signal transduction histidine kinase